MHIDFSRSQSAQARADAALQAAQLGAQTHLACLIETAINTLTGPVPLAEKLSWPAKEAAAQALLDNRATPAEQALPEAEASATGEGMIDLALRIVAHAMAWNRAIAALVGVRRRVALALAQAPDVCSVEQIMTRAEAEIAALGTGQAQSPGPG